MSRIKLLDTIVINKIAAGEVIERPGSVVKELLENSVDALATRIEVEVAQGGKELIRVVDDGRGIHPDDALLSISSHATSKIENAADLFTVQTMGFRGEALASIAAVSQFHLRSRRADSERGFELDVRAGKHSLPRSCGCPVGTLVEVHNLFCNTPVRRKFLKTHATELGHITEQFTRIALANPRLHMVLRHNRKLIYELPATERLLERLELFYGKQLAEQLVWVESELDGVSIWGFVAHPSQSKATNKGQYLFLNGRWIQDRSLQHALREAYRGLLMVGRYPITFLFLEMPADRIDVNVHPNKSEVRFQDGQSLYRQLLSMVRRQFLSMDLPNQLSVAGKWSSSEAQSPAAATSPDQRRSAQQEMVDWANNQRAAWKPADQSNPQTDWNSSVAQTIDSPAHNAPLQVPNRPLEDAAEAPKSHLSDFANGQLSQAPQPSSGDQPPRAMQIHDSYLVVETDNGLSVIDQHALHERIIYERLREKVLANAVESQRLLMPETIELSATAASMLIEHSELLAQFGMGIEAFGGNTVLLSRYPVMLAKADLAQLVLDIADHLSGAGQNPTRRDLIDQLLHTMSCKAAIKAGHRLTAEEIESLLAQRHLIDDAHHCPHGRPTALVLSRAELDRQFGRMG